MQRTNALDLAIATAALWSFAVVPAGAYIDGGSTMLVFQWVVAGLAATWFGAKMFWGRIVRLFGRRDGERPAEDGGEDAVTDAQRP